MPEDTKVQLNEQEKQMLNKRILKGQDELKVLKWNLKKLELDKEGIPLQLQNLEKQIKAQKNMVATMLGGLQRAQELLRNKSVDADEYNNIINALEDE